ncbi:MAG: tyrosine-type recombinase/integrase, partial [Verrucomicrobiota bacterium]
RTHVLQFQQRFLERIGKGEISGDTANKQMRHVKDTIETVAASEEIPIDCEWLFSKVKFAKKYRVRPPFEAAFVEEKFVLGKELDGLNEEARQLIAVMIETGARESEIIGLMPEDFFLDAEVPHIWIRKNEVREIKTQSSDRKIPLVGIALEAARRFSETGMLRYQPSPDGASSTINKYLRENGLKPTPKHTLYSLRHCFKDRLRDAGAPEEVILELMGHAKHGPQYGRGHKLETKETWLQKIAFTRPPKPGSLGDQEQGY